VVGAAAAVLGAELQRLPVSVLRLARRNPRRGDVAAIAASMRANGQFRPLVVNRATMEVLAGNHTLLAARELGMAELAVYLISVSEAQARRIALADNRTSDLAGYDEGELARLLAELAAEDPEGLVGTGFSQADLGALLDAAGAAGVLEDGEAPPLPAVPRTRVGELIALGQHRLLCGDARDPGVHERLLAGEQAGLLVTDPPYGVSYRGKTPQRLALQNDAAGELEGLLAAVFAAVDPRLAPAAALYVFHPAGAHARLFWEAFLAQGWLVRQGLVWVKDALVLGHADYHYRHEPILYGFKPGSGRLGRGGSGWNGDSKQTSVFELPRPRASREHPTMKPVELLGGFIRNSSLRGELVLDPFAGSGSTLLACEQLGRRARLVELDPG
jgi:site-specific DNA-methyltransferase (adenine-specific)